MTQTLVCKFGGTSVGDLDRLRHVAQLVGNYRARGDRVAVVVSAMADETNRLLEIAKDACTEPPTRELDALLSTGETASAAMLAMLLTRHGTPGISLNAVQAGFLTDARHSQARIRSVAAERVESLLDRDIVPVVAGFQGVSDNGDITTLGRGGSDLSAVALAIALQADACLIYTDVSGVFSADPRIVQTKQLQEVTFEEMLEASSLGAKILQVRSVNLAGMYGLNLRVLSSFSPEDSGTLVRCEKESTPEFGPLTYKTYNKEKDIPMEKPEVSFVAQDIDVAKITLRGVSDSPGVAAEILHSVAIADINVDVIVQNVATADTRTDFSFTVRADEAERARRHLEEHNDKIGASEVQVDTGVAKVSVVGMGMRSHTGIAAKAFQALADAAVNIQMIATSEIKITVVVDENYVELAVRKLCEAFDLLEQ